MSCPREIQDLIKLRKEQKAILQSKSGKNFKNVLIEHLLSMKVRDILLNGPTSRIGLTKEEHAILRQQVEEELKADMSIMSTYEEPIVLKRLS